VISHGLNCCSIIYVPGLASNLEENFRMKKILPIEWMSLLVQKMHKERGACQHILWRTIGGRGRVKDKPIADLALSKPRGVPSLTLRMELRLIATPVSEGIPYAWWALVAPCWPLPLDGESGVGSALGNPGDFCSCLCQMMILYSFPHHLNYYLFYNAAFEEYYTTLRSVIAHTILPTPVTSVS